MRKIGNESEEILSLIPQWMRMSKEDSMGGAILTEVGNQIALVKDMIKNLTIDLLSKEYERPIYRDVDIFDVDFLYKYKLPTTLDISNGLIVYKVFASDKELMHESSSTHSFYKEENGFIYDRASRYIYIKRILDENLNTEDFSVLNVCGLNIAFSSLELHHVWNPLDEIGLLLGIKRITGETNSSYKSRLFDVFKNPGNSSENGMINYLSRALNIAKGDMSVKSLNSDFINSLLNADKTPTNELREYIAISNKINNLGHKYYWSTLNENNTGLFYLPMVWNSYEYYMWDDKDISSGIGYDDDLEISFSDYEPDVQDVEYSIWAEGLSYPDREVYPEHNFKYKVYASGTANKDGYSPEQYHYKIKAGELINLVFDVIANAKYLNKYKIEMPNSSTQITTDYQTLEDKFIISRDATNSYDTVIMCDGTYCINPAHDRLYILANLFTKDDSKTPSLSKIEINYKANDGTKDINKKIIIEGEDGIQRINDTTVKVGFKENSWADTSPIIRVKQDTNDMQQTLYNDETNMIELVDAEYYKEYTSGGDWEDGLVRVDPITKERRTMNLRLNNQGHLTLDNI